MHLLTLLFSVGSENGGSSWNHRDGGSKRALSRPQSPWQCTTKSLLNRWPRNEPFSADCESFRRVNSGGNNVGFTGPEASWIAPALPRRSNPGAMVDGRRYSTPIRQSFGCFIEWSGAIQSGTIQQLNLGTSAAIWTGSFVSPSAVIASLIGG